MAVVTPPDMEAPEAPVEAELPEPAPVAMTVYIANAILTQAPLTMAQLDCARVAYHDIATRLVHAGPRFSGARRDAIDMHNRVVRRMNGAREEARRRRTVEEEERLLEISP